MKLMLFLSHNGILSRRKAFEAIKAGAVAVNGRVNLEPSTDVDPARDQVHFHARLVNDRIFEYVMLNKPEGYVTTCEKQFGQPTVMDLLPKELKHLRPVGRLDKDTGGLLLFTNDGDLANRLAHPSFDVNKTYLVRVRGKLPAEAVRRLETGVVIDNKKTAPASVALIRAGDDVSEFQITIHEGRKHQVRLMADAVGHPVVYLSRLSQGPLELGGLPGGQYRRLSEEEAMLLKRITRPASPGSRKAEAKPPVTGKQYAGRRGRGEFNRDQRLRRDSSLREKERVSAARHEPSREVPVSRQRSFTPREGGRPEDPRRRPYVPKEGGRSADARPRPPRPEYSSRAGHRSSPRSGERPAPAPGPKPLFSSASDKRRFSSTREWHSDSDVHSPKNSPKPPNKKPFRRP